MRIDEIEPASRSTKDGSEMRDLDDWLVKGVHWHAYVENRDDSDPVPSLREHRLHRVADAVLHNPGEVVDWIARMVREQTRNDPIRLIGPGGGDGRVGDEAHIERDRIYNLDSAHLGDSIYADITRENDRMYLWVEAVTESDCWLSHSAPDPQ